MLTSTSFWQFLQPSWCQTVAALLFLWICQWGGEGGQVAWATACPPYHNAQAYIHPHHQLYTHNCTWRGHFSFAIYMVSTQHGRQQILVISHHSTWHRVWHQGLLLMVGEIFMSHWTATTCLKLGSPQSVRCCPVMVCLLHWVHGD